MKKIVSLILALVMALGCTLALTSCGDSPELDFNKAKLNLEALDYFVTVYENEDVLREEYIGANKALYAKKDDEKLYIAEFENSSSAKLYVEKYELELERKIEYAELEIEYYEHLLDEYAGQLDSEDIDDYNDEIKELKKDLEEYENEVVGRSGNIAWYGTKAAVEASRGV